MKRIAVLLPLALTLTACATTSPAPQKPVLSCKDCNDLVYYGPPAPAPEHPAVAALKVLAGAGTAIAGYSYMSSTAQNITDTAANAGKYAIVTQPDPTIVTQPDPTIVTQPSPTIVTQPSPIVVDPTIVPTPDPVIVNPVIVEP